MKNAGLQKGNTDRKIDLTDIVNDRDVMTILRMLIRSPATPREISAHTGIPIAKCYRVLSSLEKKGVVVPLARKGKMRRGSIPYRANLENAYVYAENGRIRLRFETVLSLVEAVEKRAMYG